MLNKNAAPENFKFEVSYRKHWSYSNGDKKFIYRYEVSLPHQCDSWSITASTDRMTAMLDMKRFIAQAEAALAKLEEMP
jgi:hypothetical protein